MGSATFDADKRPDQRERILAGIREVELLEKDYPGFRVEKRFYRTLPGLCATIVDNGVLSVTWNTTSPGIPRLRM